MWSNSGIVNYHNSTCTIGLFVCHIMTNIIFLLACRLTYVVLIKPEHLLQMTWYVLDIVLGLLMINLTYIFQFMFSFFLDPLQEFCGVVGLTNGMNLESDMTKVPARTVQILAACHALVFVDNKLVWWFKFFLICCFLNAMLLVLGYGCQKWHIFLCLTC